MAAWNEDELSRIGDSDELQVSPRRPDGTLRPATTIWAIRVGDAIYIRSAHGTGNGWFRRAVRSASGRISAGGVERDVTFSLAPPEVRDEVTAAYHAKYDHYGERFVGPVTGPDVLETTLRVMPAD